MKEILKDSVTMLRDTDIEKIGDDKKRTIFASEILKEMKTKKLNFVHLLYDNKAVEVPVGIKELNLAAGLAKVFGEAAVKLHEAKKTKKTKKLSRKF